jgi:hypothetical protein
MRKLLPYPSAAAVALLALASLAPGACSSNVATTSSGGSAWTPTHVDCTNAACPAGMQCVISNAPLNGDQCLPRSPDGGVDCGPGGAESFQFDPDCAAGDAACTAAGVCVNVQTPCTSCGCFATDPCAVWNARCGGVESMHGTVSCM